METIPKTEPNSRPCISWRQSGGFWSLHEDGEGERLRISHSIRGESLDNLSDDDLTVLNYLIAAAIEFRKNNRPNTGTQPHSESDQSAKD